MTERLVDAQGNPVGQTKKVITSLDEGLTVELSQRGMAMMEMMVSAEMIHNYAIQSISQEVEADELENVREAVQDRMEQIGNFNLETIKYRLIDALQVVMTHFAEIYLMAEMAKELEEPSEDTPEDAKTPEDEDAETSTDVADAASAETEPAPEAA